MPLLKVEDLTKTFKARKRLFGTSYFNAVENISFSLERQQTLAIIGKNGSGKSTLAKILLGLYKSNESGSTRLISKNSVVFQDFCKYPLDVRNNIELGSESSADSFAIMKSMGFKNEYYEKLLGKEIGGLDL